LIHLKYTGIGTDINIAKLLDIDQIFILFIIIRFI